MINDPRTFEELTTRLRIARQALYAIACENDPAERDDMIDCALEAWLATEEPS